jgi:hypothetical protein
MKYIFYLLCFNTLKAQFKVFDFNSKNQIEDVIVTIYYNNDDDTLSFINNKNISDKIYKMNFNKIKLSHIAYKNVYLKKVIQDSVFLQNKDNELKEVVVTNRDSKNKVLRKIITPFVNYTNNLGFKDKFVTFFNNIKLDTISTINLEIINTIDVKDTKYLPFRVVIFSNDTINNLPDQLIFRSGIVKKTNNKKYVEFNLDEYNIIIDNNGLFIGIEILDESFYTPTLVYSKYGFISNTPSINAKIYDPNSIHKSYEFRDLDNPNKQSFWKFVPCHLNIKLKYKNE